MGLFAKIFGGGGVTKADRQPYNFFKTFTAYMPSFHNYNGAIYESELVRAAIDARARHISKLQVTVGGKAKQALRTRLKKQPNDWQTWSQFLYRTSTILDVTNTAFIVPVFNDYGDTIGIYTVLPQSCEIIETKNGRVYLRYTFRTGSKAAIEIERCGILTKHQYKDDFFGENNGALLPTMATIDIQNQGIAEAVKNGATYRFMATASNFAMAGDLANERKRFSKENLQGDDGGGVLLFPNTYKDVKQIDSKPFVIDAAQMEIIKSNVFNYFGVNEKILKNEATGDSWAAFYEGAVEVFSIQLSEVLTKMLFTERERGEAEANEIVFTSNRLQYMTNSDKLNVAAQMADRGLMTRNELRAIFNLSPLPEEIGDTIPARGEYYNVNESAAKEAEKTPTESSKAADESNDTGNDKNNATGAKKEE